VLVSPAAPRTWHQRAIEAVFAPGDAVLSHAAAARLHGLDGFDRYDFVDVLCRKGWWPHPPPGTITHFTRGLTDAADVTEVDSRRVLTVPATLTLLAPTAGLGPTARALDSALRLGHHLDELREVAIRWKRRGRAGPPTLLVLLDERDGRRLPRSWFQRLAKTVLERTGIRLVDEYPVRDERGILIAELDLAEPRRKIGIECQSWRWHATPDAQHRDARRRGALRTLGWEIVDVWWRDLDQPNRIIAELHHLLTTRPVCAR
jgi:very-short-patch-repair endonuclease